ncbi:MAG: aldehyde dehydrogenase family protein, partial [Arenicella sp.]|nr:aldehyde dehydrogenase family protein [Arenicella sp.]
MTKLNNVQGSAFLNDQKRLLINGQWIEYANDLVSVHNPSTGDVITEVPQVGRDVAEQAIKAARTSFDNGVWTRLPAEQRSRILWRVADLIEQNAEELAWLESINTGKPYLSCLNGEIPFAAQCFRYYAGWVGKVDGRTKSLNGAPDDEFHAYTKLEPIGVAALIVPWNGPLVQTVWKLAPALAAGCSCILKPAEVTPLTALRLGELIIEAGVPDGVVNIITGKGSVVGAALSESPLVDKVSFTGSTQTGRIILNAAGTNFKKVTLELGGKSPIFVFADADIQSAIDGAADAIFSNAGQVCVAGSRLYIEKSIYQEVLEGVKQKAESLKVGDGFDADTQMGPLISEQQLANVSNWVQQGVADGATLITGGKRLDRPGFYLQPTIFSSVDQSMSIVQEEI